MHDLNAYVVYRYHRSCCCHLYRNDWEWKVKMVVEYVGGPLSWRLRSVTRHFLYDEKDGVSHPFNGDRFPPYSAERSLHQAYLNNARVLDFPAILHLYSLLLCDDKR